MFNEIGPKKKILDYLLLGGIGILLVFSVITLTSIAPSIFPTYYVYLALSLVAFFLFSKVNFSVISLFSNHLYILSIVLLLIPIVLGQLTRGTIRWVNVGALTAQPSELVRPFLLIFFANFLTAKQLNFKRLIKALGLLALPLFLIIVQPSLGVAVLTTLGFVGIILSSSFEKKYLLFMFLAFLVAAPIGYNFLKPYQKERIMTFVNPTADPYGAGYNSLQSQIAVGSGSFLGKGLGKGTQTQLSFLPERQTDFIFASISEELGLIGAVVVILLLLMIYWRLTVYMDNAESPAARTYLSGFFVILLSQTFVHVGMNMGLLPITGVPLPLVSAGGSSLLGTMMGLGIALGAKSKVS